MVSEKIKLLSVSEANETFKIELEVEGERKFFSVAVIDSHGLFGVEFPVELSALLRDFSNAENQQLVREIKKQYRSLHNPSILQVA